MADVPLRTFLHPRYWYAWPVLALVRIASWLPSRVLWILGMALGSFFSWFRSPARRVAERNIELCFPEMGPQERRDLMKKHFRLSGFAVLSLGVAWWAPKWRIKRFIKLRDMHFLADVRSRGENAILLVPHFLGLDIGAMRLSMDGNYVSMYRRSRNNFLEYLFQRRSRFGAPVVERASSLKTLIRIIRQGVPFYYLPDQDYGPRDAIFVPFFSVPASTITGLSRLAMLSGARVVPCVTRMFPGGGGYEVRFYPAWDNFPGGDAQVDARRMNAFIEERVLEMPEQYNWAHKRFKTRPPGEPKWY